MDGYKKGPIYSKTWFKAVVIFFICAGFGGVLNLFQGDDDNPKELSSENVKAEDNNQDSIIEEDDDEKPKDVSEKFDSVEEYTLHYLEDKLGEENVEKVSGGDYMVSVTARKDSTIASADRFDMLQKTFDLAESIRDEYGSEAGLSVIWKAPFVDKYGNADYSTAIKIRFDDDTMEKLNFENLTNEDIPDFADLYEEHDAFK